MPPLFPDLPDQPAPAAPSGGAPRLRRPDRDQMILTPGSLDNMLPPDHQVRLVDAFVARLDLAPLRDAIKSARARPAIPRLIPPYLSRCGCMPPSMASAAPANLPGCANSACHTNGYAAVSA